MASLLARKKKGLPQSVCVYGAPKAGKTLLTGKLAHDFKLVWFDTENGGSTLFQLPEEAQENVVQYFNIPDTADNPNAIHTLLKVATGRKVTLCDDHGIEKSKCTICRKNPEATYTDVELAALPTDEYVVVFDSFTQAVSSAGSHVGRNLDLEKESFEFKHWKHQGVLLEKFLDLMQNAPYNVVVVTHEEGIDQVDGTEKIIPSGGTKNFARKVPKYFGHIVHCALANKKHKVNSITTGELKALAGSRTNIEVDIDAINPLLPIFKLEAKQEEQPVNKPNAGLAKAKAKIGIKK